MAILVCELCGVKFKPIGRSLKQRFCSRECSYKSPKRSEKLSRKMKGRRLSPSTEFKKGRKSQSYWLGKKNPALSERNKRRYVGSGNPAWKGGVTKMQGYKAHYNRLRKKRMKEVVGRFSFEEWVSLVERYNNSCGNCNVSGKEKRLTVDHIIPISKGGSNWISNIQPLCQSCNSRKKDKIITKQEHE